MYFGPRMVPVLVVDSLAELQFEIGIAPAPNEDAIYISYDYTPLDTLVRNCDYRTDLVARYLKLFDKVYGLQTTTIRSELINRGDGPSKRAAEVFDDAGPAPTVRPGLTDWSMGAAMAATSRPTLEAVPHQIIVALATMLGGGKITLDPYDLENSQRIMDNGDCQITVTQDPPKITIEIKETL